MLSPLFLICSFHYRTNWKKKVELKRVRHLFFLRLFPIDGVEIHSVTDHWTQPKKRSGAITPPNMVPKHEEREGSGSPCEITISRKRRWRQVLWGRARKLTGERLFHRQIDTILSGPFVCTTFSNWFLIFLLYLLAVAELVCADSHDTMR